MRLFSAENVLFCEVHDACPYLGGGSVTPTTRVAPLPRGLRTPHATDGASGGGGAVALRLAGGVASELRALFGLGKDFAKFDDRAGRQELLRTRFWSATLRLDFSSAY